jgi:hypothetical protein
LHRDVKNHQADNSSVQTRKNGASMNLETILVIGAGTMGAVKAAHDFV